MDEIRISVAGDSFYAAAKKRDRRRLRLRLAKLEERYRHELMDDQERQELRDQVLRLRRRLGR